MKYPKYVVVLTSLGLCLYHSYAWRYYEHIVDQSRASGMASEGMWEIQLALIHMGLSALILLIATSAILTWRYARYSTVLIGIGIAVIYAWWYLERYNYLRIVYELDSNSVGADSRLGEIGFFLGATQTDHVALGITLLLVPAVLIWFLKANKHEIK